MTYKDFLAMNPYDGMPITCEIEGQKIDDAKLSKGEKAWYVCQNEWYGMTCKNTHGYKYSWFIFFVNDVEDEEIEGYVTNLKPKPMDELMNIKAGDLLQDKDGYYRRALSEVKYPQLGELATVDVSYYSKNKDSTGLKEYCTTRTIFELKKMGTKIVKEETKPTTEELTKNFISKCLKGDFTTGGEARRQLNIIIDLNK